MKVADIEVKPIDHMGSDLSVVNAARVSFDKESDWGVDDIHDEDEQGDYVVVGQHQYLKEADVKLINYLAKHKHYSPFNHTFLTFRIKAPIYAARQLVKHKFMPWNEISRRYVDSEPEFYMPPRLRARADNVKQGSSDAEPPLANLMLSAIRENCQEAVNLYTALLEDGLCPEQARMVLPHNLMTEWYWSGTLGAFADMLRLRLKPDTQYESRVVANLILPEIEKIFPVSINALLSAEATTE